LVKMGYKGYYSFEWEKVWHPDIEEPEIAFPDFARVVSQYLRDAGSRQNKSSAAPNHDLTTRGT
jgi:hypothetical protein